MTSSCTVVGRLIVQNLQDVTLVNLFKLDLYKKISSLGLPQDCEIIAVNHNAGTVVIATELSMIITVPSGVGVILSSWPFMMLLILWRE